MYQADERDYAEERENLRILHTGDGEGYCSNPDCRCGGQRPVCSCETPSWVAGLMVVHPEDIEVVARMRRAHGEDVECARCGGAYAPIYN